MSGSRAAFPRILVAAFLAGSLAARASEDADSIRSLRAESNQAIAAHEVDALIHLLDDEYVITTSSGDILQGREENAASWKKAGGTRRVGGKLRAPGKFAQSYMLVSTATESTAECLMLAKPAPELLSRTFSDRRR